MNFKNSPASVVKNTEIMPVETCVSTVMPKTMNDAINAANAATAQAIHDTLDKLAKTPLGDAVKVHRISLKQKFKVVPDEIEIDIEIWR